MNRHFWVAFFVMATSAIYAQTTLEEYNYATKGYKTQLENGYDEKKDYKVINLTDEKFTVGQVHYSMNFKGLYRNGESSPCAVIIIFHPPGDKPADYVCVPHYKSSPEIWRMCYKHITEGYFSSANDALLCGIARAMSFFAQNN